MSLINEIKKNPDMRRIFGRKEIEIIEKQLLGISLKPSERTRLSRDIRKKFQAIKRLCLYEQQLDLKKGAEIEKAINNSKEEILKNAKNRKIIAIYVFGSTIDKTRRLNSDIDLAVEFNNITKSEAVLFRKETLGKVDEKIDLQVYNTLPENIKQDIKKKGRLVWRKE